MIEDKEFNRTTLKIDTVVTCHTRPNTELFEALKNAGVKVLNAGDAVRPRNLNAAVTEGAAFGLNVDSELLMNPNHAVMNNLPIDVLGQLR